MVEMAIVLAIAALALSLLVPMGVNYMERGRLSQAIAELGEMSKTIRAYDKSHGVLPDSLADVNYDGRLDPWGFPYEYFNLRTAHGNGHARKDKVLKPLNSDFDLYSVGADGQTQPSLTNAASRDDVVRARDGAFIGTAAEFDP
jgi:general secretion pathway protein G